MVLHSCFSTCLFCLHKLYNHSKKRSTHALKWTVSLYSFTYTALPAPTVDIVVDGSNIPGQQLSLTCVVGVVNRLVVQPVITWEKYASNESVSVNYESVFANNESVSANNESVSANNINVEPSRGGNNSTLSFLPLRTSDAGLYTCRVTLVIDSINVIMTTEDTQNITLQSKNAWTLVFSLILIVKHQGKCSYLQSKKNLTIWYEEVF